MEFRTLGKTGLSVSKISYGASPLGGVFGGIDEDDGIRTVHLALDLGINYIDCSPYYGITKAEQVLGKALKEIDRDRYYLATKVGRYGDEEFDFSAERVTQSVDESLQRLGVDHIDVIQCHDIEFGSLQQIVEETIPTLRRIQESGKVRFIGITGLPFKALQTVLDSTEVDTVLSYCHYCLNDHTLQNTVPYWHEKGVGIINASVLSMGLLTLKGPPDWHPAPLEIRNLCYVAAEYCESKGVPLPKLALQFALANESIHTTLVGTANPTNLKRNVEWMTEPMDESLLQDVLNLLQPVHNQTWESGRPENN